MAYNATLMHRSEWRTPRVPFPLVSTLAFALVLAPFLAPASAPFAGTAASAQPASMQSQGQAPDKFRITAQEKAACTSDAIRFCMHTYPDEDQLLACMKQNHDALTATCRVAFDAGVRRRRL